MAERLAGQDLLADRGEAHALGAFVVAAAFERGGRFCAFALGDGSLHIAEPGTGASWRTIAAHEGVILALAPDVAPASFISGGDDGAVRRTSAEGVAQDIARFGSRWVEHVATHPGEQGAGLIAAAVGRQVQLFDAAGNPLKTLEHPSTATGIAFDRKGKRIAASHYNGASLWFVAAKEDHPRTAVQASCRLRPCCRSFVALPRSCGKEYVYPPFCRQPPSPWAIIVMARIVQKFGGTSVAGIDRIKNVARRVKREVDAGNEVAVVVSAMAGA
ncbi:MAG: hypothetical protein ACREH9_11650, partial [Pseudomonadota bacterium]